MVSVWLIAIIDIVIVIVVSYLFIYQTLRSNDHNKHHNQNKSYEKPLTIGMTVVLIIAIIYFSSYFYTPSAPEKISVFPESCDVLQEKMFIQTCKTTDSSHCYAYKTNESIGIERLDNGIIFITAYDYKEGGFVQYSFYNNEKHSNEGTDETFIVKIHDRVAQYLVHLDPGTYEHTKTQQFLTCFEDVVRVHNETIIDEIITKRDLEAARERVEEKKKGLLEKKGINFSVLDDK